LWELRALRFMVDGLLLMDESTSHQPHEKESVGMSDAIFRELRELNQSQGAGAAIDHLIESLTQQQDYDELFNALLLKKRFEMGLPLVQPSTSDGVPDDRLDEFEQCYIASARKVGKLFLAEGQIPQAWVYLRYIREPEPVREALDKFDPQRDADDETDDLINVALYEGAHPVKGLEIMLRVNGTCNTITALDQQIHQFEPDVRRQAAALLVRELYDDLTATVRQDVEQRLAGVTPPETLRELLAGRDWLFEDGNYHIDVSHLNAVVRFARFLTPDDPELDKAMQLAEYGSRLAPQFQYPADPPFDEFYPSHLWYFRVLADQQRDEGLQYFRAKIDEEPDDEDKPMIAYVLVDLLLRIGRPKDALDVAKEYLQDVEDPNAFSFAKLCEQAGRLDLLQETAVEHNDPVMFAAAMIQIDQPEA
jgi:hypothetical protein